MVMVDYIIFKTHPTAFIASVYNHVISYDVSCICNLIGLEYFCGEIRHCMCKIPDHSSQTEWAGAQTNK